MNTDNVFLNLFPNTIQWHACPCVFVIPRFPSYVHSEVLTDGHSIIITTIIKYSNLLLIKVVQYC